MQWRVPRDLGGTDIASVDSCRPRRRPCPKQGDNMKRILVAIVVATVLVVVQAHAVGAQMSVPAPDQQFMIEAARGGIAEVEMGRMASQRAASEPVRQFGQRMVTEHGAANQELLQLAQRKGVTLPQEMDAMHRATMDRLATLSGAAFDQTYMNEMMKDHQQATALFTREAQQGQDAELRAWAMKTLPTLQEHQRVASAVHSRIAQAPVPPAAVAVPAPAASPATVTTVITTTVAPLPPYCGGAFLPGVGTNFGACK
jgi:putative membrane protein